VIERRETACDRLPLAGAGDAGHRELEWMPDRAMRWGAA
jgi:hypothetical protein